MPDPVEALGQPLGSIFATSSWVQFQCTYHQNWLKVNKLFGPQLGCALKPTKTSVANQEFYCGGGLAFYEMLFLLINDTILRRCTFLTLPHKLEIIS